MHSHLKRFDHAGMTVRNLKTSADWYKRVLGFEMIHQWTTTWMVGKDTMRLGLFQRPEAKDVDDPDQKIVISHVAFLTTQEGFEHVQADLKAKGVEFDPPEDTGIAKSIFIYDPDGHQLEVTYYYTDQPPLHR